MDKLANRAGKVLGMPPDRILTELLKREDLGSTGLGGGVAIPHARLAQVGKPFGMLVRLRRPIDFDAVDEEPVDLVFLLLLPETPDRRATRRARLHRPQAQRPGDRRRAARRTRPGGDLSRAGRGLSGVAASYCRPFGRGP